MRIQLKETKKQAIYCRLQRRQWRGQVVQIEIILTSSVPGLSYSSDKGQAVI